MNVVVNQVDDVLAAVDLARLHALPAFASAMLGRTAYRDDACHEPAAHLCHFLWALDVDVVGDARDHLQVDIVALGDAQRGAGRRGAAAVAVDLQHRERGGCQYPGAVPPPPDTGEMVELVGTPMAR